MIGRRNGKQLNLFLLGVSKLTPVEFCGLAKFLGVPLTTPTEDPDQKEIPREASDILNEMTQKFCLLGRQGRRQIMTNIINPINKRG